MRIKIPVIRACSWSLVEWETTSAPAAATAAKHRGLAATRSVAPDRQGVSLRPDKLCFTRMRGGYAN